MSLYKNKYNPISQQLNLVPTATIVTFKSGVANAAALPLSGNNLNDGRITSDTNNLYVWDGLSWINQGDLYDLTWAALQDKPLSSVANIDSAVSLKHAAHSDDQDLSGKVDKVSGKSLVADTEISKIHALHADDQDLSGKVDKVSGSSLVADTEIAKIHAPGSDNQVIPDQLSDLSDDATHRLVTDTEKSTWNDITDVALNVILNAFRIAQIGSLTIFSMIKGFMDEYEDESGIDLVNSVNKLYNVIDDCYSNQSEIDSYTKSLLHCDGTNGSQTFVDEIGKTVTAYGNAQLSTSQKKFGSASAHCPASGDSVVISAGGGSDFNLPYLTDFTIDWWEYRTSGATFATAVMGSNGDSFPGLILGYYETYLKCCISGGSGWDVAENKTFGSLTLNTWKHYALTCESGTYRTFQDGVKQDEWVKSDRGIANMPGISLGGFYNLAPFIGYIDEFRFSKGIARWTSNFVPTSGYYAFSGNMTLLSNIHSTTTVPTSSRIVIFEEDVDSITLNTDIKAYVSRDNGTTFSQVTLADEGNYITEARVLSGLVDISGQPSGTNLKYKIQSFNDKILRIHGTGMSYK